MRVVEVACKAEERDYSCEFVKDEKGRYVCNGRISKSIGVLVEELGEPAVEALDARLRRRGRCDGLCCVAAYIWVAEELGWTRRRSYEALS